LGSENDHLNRAEKDKDDQMDENKTWDVECQIAEKKKQLK
jgi:hypothetical protein